MDGCSNYQVSSLGNVKNIKLNKLLKIDIARFQILNNVPRIYVTSDDRRRGYGLARLVLGMFEPRDTTDKLFAIHIDGNKYNNDLANLIWSVKFSRYETSQTSNAPLKLRVVISGENIYFDTIKQCKEWLSTLNLNISSSSISNWCYQKKVVHGYQFEFVNEDKYLRNIPDLNDEEWKLYYETPKTKNKHYISSHGRSKRVSKSGKETMSCMYFCDGYYRVTTTKIGKNSPKVARLVATYFVNNPNDYQFVDHIDGDTKNNHVSNLRWVKDQRQNVNNPIALKRYSEAKRVHKKVEQLHLDGSVLKVWDMPIYIQRSLGYNSSNILCVCRGKAKTAYGYKWRFCETEEIE
eukprot:812391_1